jgi:hypothetical protein
MTMQLSLACGGVCALLAASSALAALPAAAAPPVAAVTVAGLRAQLGEMLDVWRAAPAPTGFAGYDRVCRTERWAPASPLVPTRPENVVACTWQKTLGRYVIRPSVRLQPGDNDVSRLTWYFRDGRLEAVAADMTTDAYDAVVRSLATAYGPVVKTVRRQASTRDGRLPQVLMTWRGGGSLAAVTDPAPPRWKLRLLVADDGLPATRLAQARSTAGENRPAP